MLCQECRRKPASVKITAIMDHQKSEVHLCEECARSRGELEFGGEAKISVGEMLAALLHHQAAADSAGPSGADPEAPAGGALRCPGCGLTYQGFTKQGKLGCPSCYDTFDRQMRGVLRHVHGGTRHVGRLPVRAGGAARAQRQLQELRSRLAESVQEEQFERAAALRDQIRQLEAAVAGAGRAEEGPVACPRREPEEEPR